MTVAVATTTDADIAATAADAEHAAGLQYLPVICCVVVVVSVVVAAVVGAVGIAVAVGAVVVIAVVVFVVVAVATVVVVAAVAAVAAVAVATGLQPQPSSSPLQSSQSTRCIRCSRGHRRGHRDSHRRRRRARRYRRSNCRRHRHAIAGLSPQLRLDPQQQPSSFSLSYLCPFRHPLSPLVAMPAVSSRVAAHLAKCQVLMMPGGKAALARQSATSMKRPAAVKKSITKPAGGRKRIEWENVIAPAYIRGSPLHQPLIAHNPMQPSLIA